MMEPFEKDELSNGELDDLLRKWESPAPPARLRSAVFPETAHSAWRRLWHASIRIPAPAAFALATVMALAIWRWPVARPGTAPVAVTKTVRVEVPVIQERIVTKVIYRDRVTKQPIDVQKLRPVAELRPVIIRRENVRN
jgi:hypothetical protein